MSAAPPPPPGGQRREHPQNIATTITEVSERATLLVREEIELAKAEITEKATRLARGAVVGVAAGIFFVMALVFALVGCAWLLYYYLPGNDFTYFWGFFAMAVILLLLGALAGFIAARVVRRSAPPVPSMAIDEARKIRDTVSPPHDGPQPASGSVRPAMATTQPATGTAQPATATAQPATGTAQPATGTAPPSAAPPAEETKD